MVKKEYTIAIEYFHRIWENNSRHPQTLFGLSLSLFKLERYEEALKEIEKAIKVLTSGDDKFSYVCIRGLCHKELDNRELASKDFKFLKSFERVRTLTEEYSENLTRPEHLNLHIRDTENPHVLLTKDFYVEGEGWKHDFLDEASKMVKQVSFFKRFASIHIKAYMGFMTVKTYNAHELVFVPKDTAWVLMGGFMKLQKFCGKTKKSILTQLLIQGDFLFNSISFKTPSDFWLEAITPVEVLFVSKHHFERLWELMKKDDSQRVLGKKLLLIYMYRLHETTLSV